MQRERERKYRDGERNRRVGVDREQDRLEKVREVRIEKEYRREKLRGVMVERKYRRGERKRAESEEIQRR